MQIVGLTLLIFIYVVMVIVQYRVLVLKKKRMGICIQARFPVVISRAITAINSIYPMLW